MARQRARAGRRCPSIASAYPPRHDGALYGTAGPGHRRQRLGRRAPAPGPIVCPTVTQTCHCGGGV